MDQRITRASIAEIARHRRGQMSDDEALHIESGRVPNDAIGATPRHPLSGGEFGKKVTPPSVILGLEPLVSGLIRHHWRLIWWGLCGGL
ncbi:hypothetical protein, partial [Rhizobium hidalgonense]|uniref:hypothetical protein n=1 Tax=Rhizobium hidalgonense TaxID=1538159 RepID=UPI002871CAC9